MSLQQRVLFPILTEFPFIWHYENNTKTKIAAKLISLYHKKQTLKNIFLHLYLL